MSAAAIVFLLVFWGFVLGLNAWCFARIFRAGIRYEEDQAGDE
jgi:hypothetical protein